MDPVHHRFAIEGSCERLDIFTAMKIHTSPHSVITQTTTTWIFIAVKISSLSSHSSWMQAGKKCPIY